MNPGDPSALDVGCARLEFISAGVVCKEIKQGLDRALSIAYDSSVNEWAEGQNV